MEIMKDTKLTTTEIGAIAQDGGVLFRVWARGREAVELVLFEGEAEGQTYTLVPEGDGWFSTFVPGTVAGTRYKYRVDGDGPFPDPASRFQPEGVHGPSEVVDLSYAWRKVGWQGRTLEELVIYELHVGAATAEGTFEGLISKLPYIRSLGVTAIELMPVADFPGDRNWGYDGVSLWAPARAYGRPEDLQRLVDAAHEEGLAVILDVVYNHLGPDGNYLGVYSSDYFTERHHTPWGSAINFDGVDARPVRDFFVSNALYWLHQFQIDGLRLDATHEIFDDSEVHILRELAERVEASLPVGRQVVLIAENENNDASLVAPPIEGGYGLDGIWADDLHHQLRRALAGDHEGYYADYSGRVKDIARTLRRGWFFEGQPAPMTGKPRGTEVDEMPYPAFVQCIQNHDQIGNRAFGERLNHEIDLAAFRAASTLLLLTPGTPLLFMGQEWAASSPFLYFTDHNPELGRLVTEGRRAEFAGFSVFTDGDMREQIPDPQARQTFLDSKLKWDEREQKPHRGMVQLYKALLAMRATHPALQARERESVRVEAPGDDYLVMRRDSEQGALVVIFNLKGGLELDLGTLDLTRQQAWKMRFSSEDRQYGGEDGIRLNNGQLSIRGPGAAVLEVNSG
jgi:maltooligosyltrehalose trehalohydrolase